MSHSDVTAFNRYRREAAKRAVEEAAKVRKPKKVEKLQKAEQKDEPKGESDGE